MNELSNRIQDALDHPDRDSLHLGSLGLTELPESLLESIGEPERIRTLNLEGNNLSSLPKSILRLTKLETLNISRNQLSVLPEFIGQLTHLYYFNVSSNHLSTLPRATGQLAQLRRLHLHLNHFRQFPESVCALLHLEHLSFSGNPLAQIPDSLVNLRHLRSLALACTEIEALSEATRELTSLEYLVLGGSPLRRLPDWIGHLTALKGLDLTYGDTTVLLWEPGSSSWSKGRPGMSSRITQLPESMQGLGSLQELYLHGNDRLQIPNEILGPTWDQVKKHRHQPAQPQQILEYYFRTRRGRRPLNEAKLILVGRGGVGKTCLIKRLIHDTFNENELETPGIEIESWQVTLSDGDSVRLHVWDFGGQEILHATHQFFLTERTLYLLVLTGREGNPTADAEYWLQLIRSFGGDSRVIIALNKSLQHPFDLNRGLLLEKYPFIAEFVRTDCKLSTDAIVSTNSGSAMGIEELKQVIVKQTESMEHRKVNFPTDWFAIKERLAGMDEDFVTWDQYQEICRAAGESDPSAQRDLAKFLHILGIALNYGDDPRLHDTRVLKPRWVTEGIYSILRAGQKIDQNGVLSTADLAAALDAARYPLSKHVFLARLMERFQLCFRLPGAEERYLVPELLGDNQPDLTTLLAASGLSFRYQYEVLPEGLLPRFIVQTHIHSAAHPQWRWRSGVVLERDGCRAIVRADARERRVDILITGPETRQRGLLEVIRDKFEEQHRDLKGLTVDERVPVPDESGVTVSYRHLMTLEEEGEESCRPEGSRRPHRVGDLLNGVEAAESRAMRRARVKGIHLEGQRRFTNSTRDRVFISYSHKDRRLFEEFKTMLAPAVRKGIIDVWGDNRIATGANWKKEIRSSIDAARVAVLLVSQHFLASDFIAKHELPPLIKAAREEGVTIVWIYLSACLYEQTEIAEYQAAHDLSRPLNQLDSAQRQGVLREVCSKLVEITQGPIG